MHMCELFYGNHQRKHTAAAAALDSSTLDQIYIIRTAASLIIIIIFHKPQILYCSNEFPAPKGKLYIRGSLLFTGEL